jgi:hypothetical protein
MVFTFPDVARKILKGLAEAEQKGNPMSLPEAKRMWNGSTWDDLVGYRLISRMPDAVRVTERGFQWLHKTGS